LLTVIVEQEMKKIIVSVTNDLYTDQRVRRICEFLVANNYDVTLCGRLLKNSKPLPKTDYKIRRFKLPFTKGALFYAAYNIRLFFYLIANKSDVLLANDLDTLLANHLANKFKRGGKLYYDSHEYFTGVPELIARPVIQKSWRFIEKMTLPKVDKMYTVNVSIAELYEFEYRRTDIKVVRNISDVKVIDRSKSKEELGLPLDKRIVIIQGAGINIDRGAEEAIEAIKLVDNCVLIFVGDGDVIAQLKEQVTIEKLDDKVLFFGKRPYDELMSFTALSDIGLSLDKDTNVNYKYSLPNKIFDYIHASTPLIVTNLVEVVRVVKENNVGIVLTELTPVNLANAIKKMITDEDLYSAFKSNTQMASKTLNWDNECKVLREIYL
jgi:glycosyltransferase involved in cell wall biosynthesis